MTKQMDPLEESDERKKGRKILLPTKKPYGRIRPNRRSTHKSSPHRSIEAGYTTETRDKEGQQPKVILRQTECAGRGSSHEWNIYC
jgi:hypothetical protein